MSLTIKQLRLQKYNDIISRNRAKFAAGRTLSRTEFIKMFALVGDSPNGTYADMHRFNLKLVTAQMDVNALLRENGLYMKSRDYYSEFSIAKKDTTKNTVIRYSAEVDINSHCTTRLEAKLKARTDDGTWGTYRKVSQAAISRMGSKVGSIRHVNTINRVKPI